MKKKIKIKFKKFKANLKNNNIHHNKKKKDAYKTVVRDNKKKLRYK